MRRNIYTDSTLLAAAQKGQDELIKTALRLGYDNARLVERMSWLQKQSPAYRVKVATALGKINGESNEDHTRDDGAETASRLSSPDRLQDDTSS